jgi:hypothetical protein
MKRIVVALCLAAFVPAASATAQQRPLVTQDPETISIGCILLEGGFGYLNNGTVGPTPAPVYDNLVRYWRLMAENPNENSAILQSRMEVAREKAAQFLGASTAEVAIPRFFLRQRSWNNGVLLVPGPPTHNPPGTKRYEWHRGCRPRRTRRR